MQLSQLVIHRQMDARQLSDRYIFHAGRYLGDKEIRYLGTLIVRADVSSLEDWSHIGSNQLLTYSEPD